MKHDREPTQDEVLGMAWWNGLSERDRARWLQRAGSAIAADDRALFKSSPTAPDEVGAGDNAVIGDKVRAEAIPAKKQHEQRH